MAPFFSPIEGVCTAGFVDVGTGTGKRAWLVESGSAEWRSGRDVDSRFAFDPFLASQSSESYSVGCSSEGREFTEVKYEGREVIGVTHM